MSDLLLILLFALVAVPLLMRWEQRANRKRRIEQCRERRAAGYGDPEECGASIVIIRDTSVPECVYTKLYCNDCRQYIDRWTIK